VLVAGADLRLLEINTRPKQPNKESCIKQRISLRIHQHGRILTHLWPMWTMLAMLATYKKNKKISSDTSVVETGQRVAPHPPG